MHECKPWTHPDCYLGATWDGWYSAGFGQSRDSDALERSNFETASKELLKLADTLSTETHDIPSALDEESSVQIVRENHWAVGWVEWIAIHSSNTAAIARAQELCKRANDYPVLDEENFSRIEDDDCEQTWRECFDPSERIAYFRCHSYTASSLADLIRAMRGDWYAAANMLHSPSDLIY